MSPLVSVLAIFAVVFIGSIIVTGILDKYFEYRRSLPQLDGSEVLRVEHITRIQCPDGTLWQGGPCTHFYVTPTDVIRFQGDLWRCEANGDWVPLKTTSVLKAYRKGYLAKVSATPQGSLLSTFQVWGVGEPGMGFYRTSSKPTKEGPPLLKEKEEAQKSKIVKTKKEFLREDPFGVGSPNDED